MRWAGYRDAEPEIAKALQQYTEAGVCAAAKALRRSTRTLNRIAAEHGVKFATNTAEARAQRAEAKARLVEQIDRLAGTATQAEICARLGIGRWSLRELAEIHGIDINSRRPAEQRTPSCPS